MPNYSTPVFKKNQPDDTANFKPLPAASGSYPYHLSLKDIIPDVSDQKMVFHMVGDTGSIGRPDFQRLVAGEMGEQYNEAESKDNKPQFLYHLGDIVYSYGEAQHYYHQFFAPYRNYPGPVFAIAGNHDSDINPYSTQPYQSLDAFTTVFCDTVSRPVSFSGDTNRKSMIQPNVYWTLKSPLANIIGLHSNVPKFGVIGREQRDWFISELKAAGLERPDKAIVVCVHHAPYSADINHGSSKPVIAFLEDAFRETGVKPDIVFSGHVHNYQRFSKRYDDKVVPFIVAGAGGYDELHPIATEGDEQYTGESPLFDHVKLEKHCADKHGFLKIAIERVDKALLLTGEYYAIPHNPQLEKGRLASLADRFTHTIK